MKDHVIVCPRCNGPLYVQSYLYGVVQVWIRSPGSFKQCILLTQEVLVHIQGDQALDLQWPIDIPLALLFSSFSIQFFERSWFSVLLCFWKQYSIGQFANYQYIYNLE